MKVLILGNGVAGNTAASTIRRLDSQADITIISEETFAEYSACALPHYISGEYGRRKLFLRTKKSYAQEKIKTILGQKVTAIHPESKQIFLDSKNLSYDKLILATGARPVVPPIPGANLAGVFTLKSPGDADRIIAGMGKAVVLIGSGPIGVETAIALRKRGLDVYLIEFMDRIMPRIFDAKPSSILRSIIQEKGIKVFTGERVTSIIGDTKVTGVITDKRQIECDQVVVGVGMRPNVELAKQAGITIGSLGAIAVDRQMKTNLEDIYACGDCVQTRDMATGKETLSPLWHNAKRQGMIAGYNCLGITKIYPGAETITSLDVYGTHAATFGCIELEPNRAEPVKVVEKHIGGNYYRLMITNEKIVGAQSIGNARDMGAMLYALIKHEPLSRINRIVEQRPIPENPLYHRAARALDLQSIKG
ncbi:MAG: NAD(P)/FAD-dependent oxidoreductase [Chloroflexi bacterium]|nr:NAD(P)/FAD-dependent oxidoreductase [Chloroflexota bacterium]